MLGDGRVPRNANLRRLESERAVHRERLALLREAFRVHHQQTERRAFVGGRKLDGGLNQAVAEKEIRDPAKPGANIGVADGRVVVVEMFGDLDHVVPPISSAYRRGMLNPPLTSMMA